LLLGARPVLLTAWRRRAWRAAGTRAWASSCCRLLVPMLLMMLLLVLHLLLLLLLRVHQRCART
jgi:hypothetical protein